MAEHNPSELIIPERIDFLLEETDDRAPPKPASFYNLKWFVSYVFVFALTLAVVIAVSTASGAWKHSTLFGSSSGELPPGAGLGKWDSYEYEDLEALQNGNAEEGAGGPGSRLGSMDFDEDELPTTADLGVPELKGKCGFEAFEPSGRPQGVRLISGTMAKYKSLYGLLKSAGLSPNEGQALQKAMEKYLNVKLLRAEDQIAMYVKEDGNVFWFMEYKRSDTTIYHFLRMGAGTIDAHEVKFPTRKEWDKAGGTVAGSLYKSVAKAGLDGSIVNHFVEALGAYVNFTSQTRDGDTFKVIVSSEWIGKKFMAYDRPQALYYKGKKAGEHTAVLYPPDAEKPVYYKPEGLSLKQVVCDVPLKTLRISSPFDPNRMHPILKVVRPHHGTDFVAPTGTPCYAFADGTVKVAKSAGAMGNMVHIDHGGGIETYYGHLHGFAKGIKSGTTVKKGQHIGYVGSTGRSTGPHLHFGMKKNKAWVDPMKYLSVKTTPEKMIDKSLAEGFYKRAKTLIGLLKAITIEGEEEEEEEEQEEEAEETGEETEAAPLPAAGKKGPERWDDEW